MVSFYKDGIRTGVRMLLWQCRVNCRWYRVFFVVRIRLLMIFLLVSWVGVWEAHFMSVFENLGRPVSLTFLGIAKLFKKAVGILRIGLLFWNICQWLYDDCLATCMLQFVVLEFINQ